MNIVELIKGQLGGPVGGMLGSALGVNAESAQKAVGAGVPALLASVMGAASQPGGAQKLTSVLDGLDDGMLGNITGMLGGGGAKAKSVGENALKGLLGDGPMAGLIAAFGKFTGLGNNAGGLLAMLAPIVLGVLKGQKKSMGLDAAGLVGMLSGQKDNIMRSMPAGLGDVLKGAGLPGVSGLMASAQSAVSGATHAATGAAKTAAKKSSMGMMVPALVVAIAAAGGYFVWKNMSGTKAPGTGGNVTVPDVGGMANAAVTRLTDEANTFFGSAATSLGEIKDVASAEAALPKLQDMVGQLGGLVSGVEALPAEGKGALAKVFATAKGTLQPIIDRILAIEGLPEPVKNVVSSMVAQIGKIAG